MARPRQLEEDMNEERIKAFLETLRTQLIIRYHIFSRPQNMVGRIEDVRLDIVHMEHYQRGETHQIMHLVHQVRQHGYNFKFTPIDFHRGPHGADDAPGHTKFVDSVFRSWRESPPSIARLYEAYTNPKPFVGFFVDRDTRELAPSSFLLLSHIGIAFGRLRAILDQLEGIAAVRTSEYTADNLRRLLWRFETFYAQQLLAMTRNTIGAAVGDPLETSARALAAGALEGETFGKAL